MKQLGGKYILCAAIMFLSIIVSPFIYSAVSTFSYSADEEEQSVEKEETTPPVGVHKVNQIAPEKIEDLDKTSAIDLKNPSNVENLITYDPKSGQYVVTTKMGDIDIVTPFTLTQQEYSQHSLKTQMNDYWKEKNKTALDNYESKFDITDMKFNIGPADKVFGPGGVQIKTQGSAELKFGILYNNIQNYSLAERLRKTTTFDFDESIQLNVNAKVGEKVDFALNYNTESTFDFDQQALKLSYTGNEDEIIKSIEVGNVALTLNSNLIKGSSALFGLKTDLQFGKLSVSGIITQQLSQTQNVSSQGGAQSLDYEVDITNYDENRHFFLAHFFRNHYDEAMANAPIITSGISITRCEVWVTNKAYNFDDTRNIIAFADLAEFENIDNNHWYPLSLVNPDNHSNTLYDEVKALPNIRNIEQVNAVLDNEYSVYDIIGGEDYQKIESARRLQPSEYTVNTQLGYISLRNSLTADQVLAVAFEYTYNGQTYQVGEFSTDNVEAPDALVVKLLKGTAVTPSSQLWHLMMKNVYYIGLNAVQKEKFKCNIQYLNDSAGVYVNYLSDGPVARELLLRVMGLDKLNKQDEPVPDGQFDYLENMTIYSSNGRIIFPVLEPFGSHLAKKLGNDPRLVKKYVFQELYDSTKTIAQQMTEKNKFRIYGSAQATSGSVISLGAMNVPRGSVVVTAGGATLVENVDYTVDYIMGTVTILNQSLLASGTNINVSLESTSTYSLQRKTLVGAHLEYEIIKNLSVGATVMHLSEMPLVTKTSMGEEPIANTIWGLNAAYQTDAPWLTNALNAIPILNAKSPSSISLSAEFAHLIPGHKKIDNNPGYAYMDDFENTETTIDLSYPYYWKLASTPYDPTADALFPEAGYTNDIRYGFNRALFNWYVVDNSVFNKDNSSTPMHLRSNKDILSNHFTREVLEQELFPNRDAVLGTSAYLSPLNLSFYPLERGPYNMDINVDPATGNLLNPKSRWGGIMRKIDNTDFEAANIEYIEFWMMDPFVYDSLFNHKGGDLYINLGDISEDILRDGKKFFENGMPSDGDTTRTASSVWGRIPRTQSKVIAFDSELSSREYQDVGFDGLRTKDEFGHYTYKKFLEDLRGVLSPAVIEQMKGDQFSVFNDPAQDNYHHFRGSDYDSEELNVFERYKRYNGTEGNSPASDLSAESYSTTASSVPDAEDINMDNTLNEYEKYYQYKISIRREDMNVGSNYITDKVTTSVTMANGESSSVDWYQFKVPIREYDKAVGSPIGFTSVRFMRIFMTNFEQETHLRFGTLELVRGEWRTYTKDLYEPTYPPTTNASTDVFSVNIEENNNKEPVNYILPPGVTRTSDPSASQITLENEQALAIRVHNLAPHDARGVYKNISYDMRMYGRLQMFVHAEALINDDSDLQNYETTIFLRVGTDLTMNYYEYEIPLALTPHGHYASSQASQVWLNENMFDFALSAFTDAKKQRNAEISKNRGSLGDIWYTYDSDNKENKITIKGNPSLGSVKTIMIGVRNQSNTAKNVEVWVNELRLTDYDEDGGWALTGNATVNLSDLGSISFSGRYETAGFGGIEQTLQQRRLDNFGQLNFSAQLDFGRFFPEKAAVNIPFYYSYGYEKSRPKYNPLDEDVLLEEALESLATKEQRDSLRNIVTSRAITQSVNITNMKVGVRSKQPRIWDPANFSLSLAYVSNQDLSPETMRDFTHSYTLNFAYNFSTQPKPWEPFKNIKKLDKWKIFKEFGINYEPSNLALNISMNRIYSETQLRDLTGFLDIDVNDATNPLLSFAKEFKWSREFDIKYEFTKNIKLSLHTSANNIFDETTMTPINRRFFPTEYELWKDTIRQSLAVGGTPKDYQQVFTASWDIPINKIPYLDFLTARAQYQATYNWEGGFHRQNLYSGSTISNLSQWQFDASANFETLYNYSKYLKKVTQKFNSKNKRRRTSFRERAYNTAIIMKSDEPVKVRHNLNSEKVAVEIKDKSGQVLKIKVKQLDKNNIELSSRRYNDSIFINVKSVDPNIESPADMAAMVFTRLALLVRRVSVNYQQSSSMSMPGFDGDGLFFGQTIKDKVLSPGLKFSFGSPAKDYLEKAMDRGWMVLNDSIVNPAGYTYTKDFDGKMSLEPFPGFKIELNSKRAITEQSSIQYLYDGMPTTLTGSFRTTYCALGTAFWSTGKSSNNYASKAYDNFLDARSVMQGRLEKKYAGTRYPTNGFMNESDLAGYQYNKENGGVAINSADVLIPAFLAAYTGKDPNSAAMNIFTSYLDMIPSWKLTFDGFTKIAAIEKYFKTLSLSHSYQCTYNINGFGSYSNYVENDDGFGFVKDVTTGNPIPSSVYDIASVSISEAFAPFIGLDFAMKNNFTGKFEYRRSRVLTLNISAAQLLEALSEEYVIGVGYMIKDLDVVMKLRGGKTKKVSNDLTLRLDISMKDISTLLRKLDSTDITEATSGNKSVGVSFTADYVFSSKLNFRLFVDYQSSKPYISTSYPVENCEVGFSVKFMLTR